MNLNTIAEVAFIDELQKIAESQMDMGKIVEREHYPTIEKIKKSIKNGKIGMTNEEVYESISGDHLAEKDNPKRDKYYTNLKKFVDPS